MQRLSTYDFGALRALSQKRPSPKLWRQLTELVDMWPDQIELTEIVIPYLMGITQRWPTELAIAPKRWVDAMLDDAPIPQMMLAQSMTIQGRKLTTATARALAHSPSTTNLRELVLRGNLLSADAFAALLDESGWVTKLARLDLYNNPIGDQGALTLAERSAALEISALSLEHSELSARGAHTLLDSNLTEHLNFLSLAHNNTSNSITELEQQLTAPNLEHLSLSSTRSTTSDLESLFNAALPKLKTLDLSNNVLTSHDIELLLESDWYPQLEALDLSYCGLTDRSTQLLGERGESAILRSVDLGGNKLTDEGAVALAKTPLLPALEELRLEDNPIERMGITMLETATTLDGVLIRVSEPDQSPNSRRRRARIINRTGVPSKSNSSRSRFSRNLL